MLCPGQRCSVESLGGHGPSLWASRLVPKHKNTHTHTHVVQTIRNDSKQIVIPSSVEHSGGQGRHCEERLDQWLHVYGQSPY